MEKEDEDLEVDWEEAVPPWDVVADSFWCCCNTKAARSLRAARKAARSSLLTLVRRGGRVGADVVVVDKRCGCGRTVLEITNEDGTVCARVIKVFIRVAKEPLSGLH